MDIKIPLQVILTLKRDFFRSGRIRRTCPAESEQFYHILPDCNSVMKSKNEQYNHKLTIVKKGGSIIINVKYRIGADVKEVGGH